MDVRLGWSGDIHGTWTKMDVEIDESDLKLFFAENNIDYEKAKIASVEKFKLMYAIAEIFVQLHKMSRFPEVFAKPEDHKELEELVAVRNKIVKEIRERAPF